MQNYLIADRYDDLQQIYLHNLLMMRNNSYPSVKI